MDSLLVARGLAGELTSAGKLIDSGQVLVNGMVRNKPSSLFPDGCSLQLKARQPFVSRGGRKLEAGLDTFRIDVRGLICADIGCSTGGFTDCLLQRGAARVYSVDVGYGLLDWKLRQDNRVVVLERTNARFLTREQIPENLDLAVIDASFISLKLLLQPVSRLFDATVRIVALVKPQFELPREKIGPGGVVQDETFHEESLDMVRHYAEGTNLRCNGIIASPIQGAKGNQEFLMYLETCKNGQVPCR